MLYRIQTLVVFMCVLFANTVFGEEVRQENNGSEKLRLVDALYIGTVAITDHGLSKNSSSRSDPSKYGSADTVSSNQKVFSEQVAREVTVSGGSLKACKKATRELLEENKFAVTVSECKKEYPEL